MPVVRPIDATRYEMGGNQFDSYVAPSTGSAELCAWRLRVTPGVRGLAHRPSNEEVLLVLSGTLCGTLGGEEFALAPGDVLHVPADVEVCIDGGPEGATAWVSTTSGLEAVTAAGERLTPPWAQ